MKWGIRWGEGKKLILPQIRKPLALIWKGGVVCEMPVKDIKLVDFHQVLMSKEFCFDLIFSTLLNFKIYIRKL